MRSTHRCVAVAILFVLAGCGQPEYGVTSKAVEQELFFRCLAALPAGPVESHYNDWAEVIAECGARARTLAWGCTANCREQETP